MSSLRSKRAVIASPSTSSVSRLFWMSGTGRMHHFPDPDGIALERAVSKDLSAAALDRERSGRVSDEQIDQAAG